MSDFTTPSLNQLPLEILFGIFHSLEIPDILRLRRVSRYLNEISHSRDVWSEAYRKARFVRPPGPFLSQSVDYLENALVPSFRVDQNLRHGGGTTQRERPTLKLREIRYTGVHLCVSLIFGQFLVMAFSEEVRCYDLNLDVLDSNSGASIIYRSTGGTLRSVHCVSAIDVEGRPFACVVLNEATRTTRQISIYSFNVGERSEVTLDLLHQFEHPVFIIDNIYLGPRVIVIVGRNPDVDCRLVAMDVHTRTQFLFPSFTHVTGERAEITDFTAIEGDIQSISTSTHLLLASSSYGPAAGWNTFFQAFTLPPLDVHRHFTSTSVPLSPSHHGIIPGIRVASTFLLHDSILDSTAQDILIAIRVHAFERSRPFNALSKHGILRLSTAPVSHGHAVGSITFQLLGSLDQLSEVGFLHPSFNGIGRAFYEQGSHGNV